MNFNTAPYFDDFDESKKFYKILFRHDHPIQARELNGLQGIFQSQIKKFGNHFFKKGSRVSGGQSKALNYDWVIFRNKTVEQKLDLNPSILVKGAKLRGRVTQLLATVHWVEAPKVDDDRWTAYLIYQNSAVDGQTTEFLGGEQVDVIDASGNVLMDMIVPCPDCGDPEALPDGRIKGKGTLYTVSEGVFFQAGMFLNVNSQTILIAKYDPIEYYKKDVDIGLEGVETIVTAAEDPDLYDQSLGYPNLSAPGADRHKYDLILKMIDRPEDESLPVYQNLPPIFITLSSYVGGQASYIKADSEYADIMHVIENRTYEESGHYWVTKPGINFINHLAASQSDPTGYKVDGDDNKFVAIISPFVSYTKGHRHAPINSTYLVGYKARDTLTKRAQNDIVSDLRWIEISRIEDSSIYSNGNAGGAFNAQQVQIHIGPITDGPGGSKVPSGPAIGSMMVYDFQKIEGERYKLYVADMSLNNGVDFTLATCIHNPASRFIAKIETAKLNVGENSAVIQKLSVPNIKSLRDIDNPDRGGVSYTMRKKVVGSLDSRGSITFNAAENEIFMSGQSTEVYLVGDSELLQLSPSTLTVGGSYMTVTAGSAQAGKTVGVIIDTFVTSAKERQKVFKRQLDEFGSILVDAEMKLTKADVIGLTQIYAYNKGMREITIPLSFDLFTFDNGVKDHAYTNASIKRTAVPLPAEMTGDISQYGIFVEYEYYEHSASDGFLSVDSYSDAIASGYLKFENIPTYKSASGSTYDLANCLDFRPLIIDGNCQAATIPAPNSIVIYDSTYYVPRRDIVVIDNQGNMQIIAGIAGERPIYPKADPDTMHLFNIDVPAYVYKIEDIKYKLIPNKRYTMRDIGALDQRIKNVEYYTSLSALEAQAAKEKILDQNGLERFKNGFLVDNFRDLQAAATTDSEFKAAVDVRRGELAPSYEMFNRKAVFNPSASTNFRIMSGQLMPSFSNKIFSSYENASKTISVNPYFITPTKGEMKLIPNIDTWADTNRMPDVVATADLGSELLKGIEGNFTKKLGEWTTVNTTMQMLPAGAVTSRTAVTSGNATTTTTMDVVRNTQVQQQVRETQIPKIETRVDSYEIGDHFTDVRFKPRMRATSFEFHASKLTPGTQMYAFFDKSDITNLCRPMGGIESDPLIVDASGNLSGVANIPGDTFWVGNREFKLSNSSTNTNDTDMLVCTAKAIFHAGGVDKDAQMSKLNVISPVMTIDIGQDEREVATAVGPNQTRQTVSTTVTNPDGTTSTVTTVVIFPPPPPPRRRDPLAQSFTPEFDLYVTAIDLFFADAGKDRSLLFTDIREMKNGYPVGQALVRKFFYSDEITTSTDASTPYHVEFDFPVFLKGGTQYCWVVGGDSPQPRYFAARIGQPSIEDPNSIIEGNNLDVSFRSSNGDTWNAEQFEDLKYRLYRASFNTDIAKWVFDVNASNDMKPGSIVKFTEGSSIVRVFLNDSGLKSGDKLRLGLFEHFEIKLQETDASGTDLVSGDTYTNITTSFTFNTISKTDDTLTCTITDVLGKITTGNNISINGRGYIVLEGLPDSIFGIPSGQLNKVHTLGIVKNQRFVEIDTGVISNATGNYERDVMVSYNRQYNIVNASADILDRGLPLELSLKGSTCNPLLVQSLPANDSLVTKSLITNSDIYLQHPAMVISAENTGKPTSIEFKFSALSENSSPIMNVDSVSTTMVGFILGQETVDSYGILYKEETEAAGGSQAYKYLTRPIALEKPAYEINIFLDVYCGPSNDYEIYFRSAPIHEITKMDLKPWTQVPHTKAKTTTPGEKIELEISLREVLTDWDDLEEIASFQVKIVGTGSNSASPPLFSNLRVIAST